MSAAVQSLTGKPDIDQAALDLVRDRLAGLGRQYTPVDVASAMRDEGLIVSDSAVLDTVESLRRNSVGAGPLESLLHEPGVTDVLPVAFDENDDGASCGITVTTGERLFLVPYREGVTLGANLCTLQAPVDTEAGQELIAAATDRYGPGRVPQSGASAPGLPEAPEATADLLVVAGGIGLAIVLLFGGLLVLARGRARSA